MEPRRPDEFERANYYTGVAGVLLARTSTYKYPKYRQAPQDKHQPQAHQDKHQPLSSGPRVSKTFDTIGKHPILDIWSDKIVLHVQMALDGLEWQAFYPIRIGVRRSDKTLRKDDLPAAELVLMVDIAPGTAD